MKEKKKFGKRKTAWVVLIVLLSVVLLAALAAAIYVGWFFGKIHKDPNTEETLSPEQLQQILDEDKVATRPADVDLVEPEDADGLARALNQLLTRDREEMGRDALETVRKYTLEKMASRHGELFSKYLEERKS